MGSWGIRTFDDDALDWIGDFAEGPSMAALEEALITVAEMDESEYLEAPDASIALAAAEVVAALVGSPASDLPKEVMRWADRQDDMDPALIPLALQALARVTTNSELQAVWDDEPTGPNWHAAVAALATRLEHAVV